MSVQTLIQVRRGTASQWNSINPTLSAGEWGLETDSGRLKIGDGLTAWNTLKYTSLLPNSNDIVGTSGVVVSFGVSGVPVSLSVSGVTTSQISDFGSSVSGIVTSMSVSAEEIMDILGTGLVGASGIGINYQDASNQIVVNVTGITSSQVNDFNSSVSGLLPVKDVVGTGYVSVSGSGGTYTVSVSGLQPSGNYANATHTHVSSDITDLGSTVSGLLPVKDVVGTGYVSVSGSGGTYTVSVSGLQPSGNYANAVHTHTASDITNFNSSVSGLLPVKDVVGTGYVSVSGSGGTYTVSVSGLQPSGNYANATHTHVLADITDVTSSATELNYLDGSIPGIGVSSKALVLDSGLNITNIGSITTSGNVVVGGNLTVSGSSTIVNSTIVEIGDNIIRLNTASGVATGGIEVKTPDNDYESLVWNNTADRWEFTGSGVYTSGRFIGNLQGTADNVVTNANLTGDITSVGNATSIASGVIVNSDINASAAIAYSKLNLSGSITNTDIASNANIAVTKLASGSTGQVLQVSATGIIWGGIDGGTP